MRRSARRPAAVLVALAAFVGGATTTAGAQEPTEPSPPVEAPTAVVVGDGAAATDETPPDDLPAGFLDGVPVGGEDAAAEVAATEAAEAEAGIDGDAPAAPRARALAAASAPVTRYFGAGPWESIRVAAVNASRPCSITVTDLRAMMVAPVFKESSAATSASTSPSPMTLSRADEWTTGVMSGTSNTNANYGLYEGRDPYTPYPRAYWHPGIGIWQYDDSGVGAPYTAVERIDVSIVAADVAREMVTRYCDSDETTNSARRRAAWSPWGDACTREHRPDAYPASVNLCEIEFVAMTSGSAPFSNISTVSGITSLGGVIPRTCRIGSSTVACWYVDPGRAQGARGWTYSPTGGSPTSSPTPLAFPFYVVKRNGTEERHWLRADTGYPVDIRAVRTIGKNSRPRTGTLPVNVGSGLTWSRTSSLCDVSASRGNCGGTGPVDPPLESSIDLQPPPNVTQALVGVSGTSYRPLAMDLDGNGRTDLFWYGPGSAADSTWISTGNGSFRVGSRPVVNGTYTPIVLDANGDGRDDVLWYAAADPVKRLWLSKGDGTFSSQQYSPGAGIVPVVLDRNGDGRDEILWYGPGSAGDRWWTWSGGRYVRSDVNVSGTYQPFVGDFDGNGSEDIFWYAPGSAPDSIWMHTTGGSVRARSTAVNGTFQPHVGDFDGDGADDIVWYAPGSAGESIWWGGTGTTFATQSFTVNNTYRPVVVDLGRDGRDDVLWYDEATGSTTLWTRWSAGRGRTSGDLVTPAKYLPLAGRFSTTGHGGVFWYGRGAQSAIWWS